MGFNELSKHIQPIAEREPNAIRDQKLILDIGPEWQRRKLLDQVKDEKIENPFQYIKGEFSLYLAHFVYAIIWEALTKNLLVIRFGPSDLKNDQRPDTLDEFSEIGEGMIPYLLEAIRYDKILKEYLDISQEGSMLVIEIKI